MSGADLVRSFRGEQTESATFQLHDFWVNIYATELLRFFETAETNDGFICAKGKEFL